MAGLKWAQYASGVLGLLVVAWFAVAHLRSLPTLDVRRARRGSCPRRLWRRCSSSSGLTGLASAAAKASAGLQSMAFHGVVNSIIVFVVGGRARVRRVAGPPLSPRGVCARGIAFRTWPPNTFSPSPAPSSSASASPCPPGAVATVKLVDTEGEVLAATAIEAPGVPAEFTLSVDPTLVADPAKLLIWAMLRTDVGVWGTTELVPVEGDSTAVMLTKIDE